ncbi:MAG TPA: ABC transporter permease [Candidatus Acidoferrales bacterium]|nr:ABC transporter permease [Candidatus Acidoferrales bacterium]
MPFMRNTISGLRSLFRKEQREQELNEELRAYHEMAAEEKIKQGKSRSQALREVRLERGSVEVTREVLWSARWESLVEAFWRDLRQGARVLRVNPAFATVAILSLALGIGANAAIFELLDAVLLRTLPVAAPRELAEIRVNHEGRIGSTVARQNDFSSAQWAEVEKEQQGFSEIAAWSTEEFNLGRGGEARHAKGLWVSGDFFHMLQMRPELGRLFTKSDDYKGCGVQGAVISQGFWYREFGGRADAIGKTVSLDGQPFQIIGVTPASFSGLEPGFYFDVAVPLCSEPAVHGDQPYTADATTWWLAVTGRLKPGWTAQSAAAQLNTAAPAIFSTTLPAQYDVAAQAKYLRFTFRVLPAATGVSELRASYTAPLFVLLAISGLVLLIACANLANLMLARASARNHEMALRVTLGASRSRLIQQLLVESLLLTAIGAAAGAALAGVLGKLMLGFIGSEDNPIFLPLSADWRFLLFTTALAVLTCVLCGTAPALQAARSDPGYSLKGSGRGSTAGRRGLALRRGLVVTQVALSMVLLVAAALFVRTFTNLASVNAGLRQEGILVADFDFSPLKISAAARPSYKRDLLANVRAVAGVDAAAEATNVPMAGSFWGRFVDVPEKGVHRMNVNVNAVSDQFFRTMEVPLLAGRDFDERDTPHSPPVAIVNERFAQEVLGAGDPLGKTFYIARGRPEEKVYQIVGLVANTKYRDVREEFQPIIFLAESQDAAPGPESTFVIRSEESAATLIGALKEAAKRTSPEIVLNFQMLRTTVLRGLAREKLMATLSGFYGALAAVLAMVGLYGIISYMVARRRNEIGIRMAIGASKASILRMILQEGMLLLGAGLIIGALLALAAGSAARSMLFGVKPADPVSLAAAAAGLSLVAVLASLLPAARATAVHPMQVLREE